MRRALELNESPLLSCCAEEHHPSQTFRSFATERPFKSAHLSPPIRLHPILAIFSPASGSCRLEQCRTCGFAVLASQRPGGRGCVRSGGSGRPEERGAGKECWSTC